jgi:hypothetical protein
MVGWLLKYSIDSLTDLKLHSIWNMKNNILQIVSYNCQGLNSVEKLRDVFDYLKSKNCNIYSLQDTPVFYY